MRTILNFMASLKTKTKDLRYLQEDPRYRILTRLVYYCCCWVLRHFLTS